MKWSSLPDRTKPMPRSKKRLRSKGGRQFKQTPEDKAFWDYLYIYVKSQMHRCDGCDRFAWLQRCHLLHRSKGGRDIENIVLMCPECHGRQEKKTAQFIAATGRDLWANAKEWTERFRSTGFVLDDDYWEAC